jgi:hypothetical protein
MVLLDRKTCRNGRIDDQQRASLIEPDDEVRLVGQSDGDIAAARRADNRSIHSCNDARRFPARRPWRCDHCHKASRLGDECEGCGGRSGDKHEQDRDRELTEGGRFGQDILQNLSVKENN